jgi:hypothetical protein
MLRRLVFALLLTLGFGAAGSSLAPAEAAALQPGTSSALAQAMGGPATVGAPSSLVTPAYYHGPRHYYRPYRPVYRPYYRPYRPAYRSSCRVVKRRVWTSYGYRVVTRRVCSPGYYRY